MALCNTENMPACALKLRNRHRMGAICHGWIKALRHGSRYRPSGSAQHFQQPKSVGSLRTDFLKHRPSTR